MLHQRLFRTAFAALAMVAASFGTVAQSYPSKPIRMLVGYPPGGATDNIARQISVLLGERLGQSVVVDNRPGGSTVIAAQALISAPADGYTIAMFEPTTVSINQSLFRKPPYDPEQKISPVAMLTRLPFALLLTPSHPSNNVKEFVAYSKANPGQNFGHSGAGNAVHMAGEQFKNLAGIDIEQVSYKGGAPAIQDLMAGQIPVLFMDIPSVIQQVQAKRVKMLAVTSANRSSLLPDVPALAETYPGFEASSWYGIFVPAGTPRAITDRLNSVLREVMNTQKMKDWAKTNSHDIDYKPADEFSSIIKSDAVKYGKMLKQLNIHIDN